MSLSPRNLVFWTTLFATVGTWLALPNPTPHIPSPPTAPAPWIPLPANGMDASNAAVRDLLLSPRPADGFARHCGDFDDDGSERYRIFISKDGREDFRAYDFLVHGEWLDVTVLDPLPAPPSRPADGSDDASAGQAHALPEVRTRLAKRDAEPIRRAWDTTSVWRGEQGPTGCSDGRPFVLEACVDGRYAIRSGSCGPAAAAQSHAMWGALTSLLPEPQHRAFHR